MTVQKDVTKNIYVGNGSTRTFPFTFECPAEHPEYIKVYLMQDDGTALATSDYQLDMDARQITYPSSGTALPEGKKLVIMRELPLQQMMNLVNNGPFFAEDVELAFDENVMVMQQIVEKLNRSIIMSVDIDGDAFVNEVPFKAGKSFRIADDGKSIVLTEDPARVLPLAQETYAQAQAQAQSAYASAVAAAQSEDSAAASASEAGNSAQSASVSAASAVESARLAEGYKQEALTAKNDAATSATNAKASEANAKQASVSASASESEAKAAKIAANEAAANASNSVSEAKRYENEAKSYAENAKEYAATATTKASETTAKVIEATDEANRAKAEADRAKSISNAIGNPVSDVTENNGSVTVTKSDGTQSTFMAFPQGENGALPIVNGGTGADNVTAARTNLGIDTTYFNPTGTIIAFAGNTLPKGYLLCDGSNVSRTTYKKLFDVIGTTYGAGDGKTTFTLPNLIDRFLEGSSAAGKYRAAGLPNITGYSSWNQNGKDYDFDGAFKSSTRRAGANVGTGSSTGVWKLNFDASDSNNIYGSALTVQPAALTTKFLIKY